MMWVIFLFVLSALCYAALMIHAWWTWHYPRNRQPDPSTLQNVTIVVVARNEARTIEHCLRGILAQQYPVEKMNIVVVNDHSTDDTEEIAKSMLSDRGRVISLAAFPEYIHAPAFKKSAIELAVSVSDTAWMLVTDADCVHPTTWVATMMRSALDHQSVFVAGPVLMKRGNSSLERMQESEQLVLMLMTKAGIDSRLFPMANGANMLFKKEAFLEVHGYAGNYHWASGDDMFLMEKMSLQYPHEISFCKSLNAVVETKPAANWDELIAQRLRWSQKNKAMRHSLLRHIWTCIGVYHGLLMISVIAFCVFWWEPWIPLMMVVTKLGFDFLLFYTMCRHFKRKYLLSFFLEMQWYYAAYVIRLGYAILTGKAYMWKGRPADIGG